MTIELTLIGGGNMGTALLQGLLDSGRYTPDNLAVVEVSATRRDALGDLFPGVSIRADLSECSAAIVAVKPEAALAAVSTAAGAGARRILSIAAGVRLDALEAAAGRDVAVIRAMPNMPALVGKGAAAIAGGPAIGEDDFLWAEVILSAVGTVDRMPEHLLDTFTGVAGSGPAYIFLVAEALTDAAVAGGITRPVAERVVAQLLVGSAALLEREGDAARLRDAVTSPGGTTAAGLAVLDRDGVRAAFASAVAAAAARGRELG